MNDDDPIDPEFLYYSVFSIGLTACEVDTEYFSGPSFFDTFQHVAFEGVSGSVKLVHSTASRDSDTLHYSVSFASPIPDENGMTWFDIKLSAIFCEEDQMKQELRSEFELLGVPTPNMTRVLRIQVAIHRGGGSTSDIYGIREEKAFEDMTQ